MTRRRDPNTAPRRFWSAADDAVLRARYPHDSTVEIATALGRTITATWARAQTLGLGKDAAAIATAAAGRIRQPDHRGRSTQFGKGHVPWTKGRRMPPGYGPGRMKETWFKPGQRSGVALDNWCPIGTIRTDTGGYKRIKVREGRKGEPTGFGNVRVWPLLNRHLWAQANGPIPAGSAVIFNDGNRDNCVLENLSCIPRQALMKRNSVHNLPAPLKSAVRLLGQLHRQLKRRTTHVGEKQDR